MSQSDCFKIFGYTIDKKNQMVTSEDSIIRLSKKEYRLLLLLIEHLGKEIEREFILEELWGSDYSGSIRVVDDLVRRLRKKMPNIKMESIYGKGYRMHTTIVSSIDTKDEHE